MAPPSTTLERRSPDAGSCPVGPLPAVGDTLTEKLASAGLLASKSDADDIPRGAELIALETEHQAWIDGNTTNARLSEAVIEDRAERF